MKAFPFFSLLVAGMGFGMGLTHAQSGLDYPSVWVCDTKKFNWYCDEEERARQAQAQAKPRPLPPVIAPAPAPVQPQAAPARVEMADMKTAEQMRVELKRREDIAVMNPTDENLKDYLVLWQAVQDKGSVFADNWRRVVWGTPELDYSLRRPTNNSAVKVYDQQRDIAQDEQLLKLAKEHGLIFFFRSDCPYCHQMGPTVRMLSQKYGIEVLAVSVDGAGLPDFPQFQDGRGKLEAWGVEKVPALFIGSKQTGDKAPIGFGMMSFTEIVDRIFVLTNTKPGESF